MKVDSAQVTVRELCRELVEERLRQGLSQQKLAEMADLSRTGLRHIESLETNPTLYSLLKLAKALNVSLPRLLSE